MPAVLHEILRPSVNFPLYPSRRPLVRWVLSKRYIGFLIERDASRARRQFGCLWWPKFSNQPRDGILRWQAGEQHWSVIQTGCGQAGNYALEPVRADELELSRTRPQGGVIRLDPWNGIEVTGAPRRRSLPILPEGKNKPTFGGSNWRDFGCVARWARHAILIGRFVVSRRRPTRRGRPT